MPPAIVPTVADEEAVVASDEDMGNGVTNTKVSFWPRTGLFCLSAFLMTVGIGAIFRTDNEGGTTALVVGGMVVGFVAVLGQVPVSGSIGGVAWDLQNRLLRSENRHVATEAAEGVLEAAAATRQVPGEIVANARSSLRKAESDYFHDVKTALFRIANMRGGLTVETGWRDADALIRSAEKAVLVEVKSRVVRDPEDMANHLWGLLKRLEEAAHMPIDGILLVTPTLTNRQADMLKMRAGALNLQVAIWDAEDDDAILEKSVRLLFQESDGQPPEASGDAPHG